MEKRFIKYWPTRERERERERNTNGGTEVKEGGRGSGQSP
jgi:hypothetical protein